MSFSFSANTFYSLASAVDSPVISYVNENRNFLDSSSNINIDNIDFKQFTSLLDIKDAVITDNSIIFLTGVMTLSAILNNLKSVSSSLIGFSGFDVFNQYYWNLDYSEEKDTINLKSFYNTKNNYLLIIPYKSNYKYTVIPLKNTQGVDYEYNYKDIRLSTVTRNYDGIYADNENNIFLQYKTSTFPVKIKKDAYNTIYLPQNISSTTLTNTRFPFFGANWGNSPCNSDVIFFDRFGYDNTTNHGTLNPNYNGTPLCVWLSGNSTDSSAVSRWIERWYDPNKISQSDAFITPVNTTSAINPVIDRVSTMNITPKSKISYLRMGNARNKTYIDNFSNNLQFYLSSWGNTLVDEINDIGGFSIPDISEEKTSYGIFTGKEHYHIPPSEKLLINSNFTLGMWVYQEQWDCGIDTQYFGNFSDDEGYGLFFNTGFNNDLLTLPSTSGFIYGFNNKGYRVFEKSINSSLGITESRIDYITTDLYGARWMYDGLNKSIYKLDTDDLLTQVITLSSTANIAKMQINSQNMLYVLDTTTNKISAFDADGNFESPTTSTIGYNNFEIDQNDAIKVTLADIMTTDNNNDIIKALGTNLYKNNALFYHVGYKIQALTVDMDNNTWVLYNTNQLLKIDSNGFKVFDIKLTLPFDEENSAEMGLINEVSGRCDKNYLWIVFNTNTYIIRLDLQGNIMKRIQLEDVVNLKSCSNFYLSVRGDFSSFNNKRKYNVFSNGDFISYENPALSLKLQLICGNTVKRIQLHYPTENLLGWNHLSFSHTISGNSTIIRLFVNGEEVKKKTITGIYFINYGSKISPYIIGGRSGKLGAINVEIGLNETGYFQGKINDVRIYNTALDDFQLRGLASNLYYDGWEDMTWYMPIPETTFMEEIEGFHLNRYHGSKSNKFNIRIKNMNITDDYTKNIIESSIQKTIKKFTPINTELNEIIFE